MSDRDVITDEMWTWIEPLLPSSAGRRGRPSATTGWCSKGSAGGCGPVRRGGTCRIGSARGRPCGRGSIGGRRTGPGPGCWRPRSSTPTRPASWAGTCRSTPRSCGPTSTPPGRATAPPATRGAAANYRILAVEPPDHAIGRSRGGRTTKIHLACDASGKPMSLWLTGGNTNDTTELEAVLEGTSASHGRSVDHARPRTG